MNNYNGFNNYGGYSNGRYFTTPSYSMPMFQNRPIEQSQQQQNGIFFNNIRYVSPEDYDKYIVGLGQTDMIINKENGLVKIVSSDMVGNSFTRSFKFEELNSNKPKEEQKPEIDLSGYVKKDDLNDFIKIDALTQFSKQIDDKLSKIEKKIKISEIMEEK